jgi:hypothetical protein
VRIIKPSRFDVGAFLYSNSIADGLGYGNYSKLRGDASTKWLAIFDGFAHISAYDLLDSGNSIEGKIAAFAASPVGPVNRENTLTNDALDALVTDWVSTQEAWSNEGSVD